MIAVRVSPIAVVIATSLSLCGCDAAGTEHLDAAMGGDSRDGTTGSSITFAVKGVGVTPKGAPAASVTTVPMTFAANTLLLAVFAQKIDPGIPLSPSPTVSTAGLNWAWLQKACMNWNETLPTATEPCSAANGRRLDVYFAVVPAVGAANVSTTFTNADAQLGELHWSITEWTGADAATPFAQNISMNHRTWSSSAAVSFLDAYWSNPPYSLRTGAPVADGNLGVAIFIPGEAQHALHVEPGVTHVLQTVNGVSYLGQRIATIDPGYASATVGYFGGVASEPTQEFCEANGGANGCAHGLMVGLELAHE